MEANEVHELHEQHEHAAHEPVLKIVSFTMSILAVLVAVTTVLGHRTGAEALLNQSRASDQWNLYQAKKIRQNDTALIADLLTTITTKDAATAAKLGDAYKAHLAKWGSDLGEEQTKAQEFEADVKKAERRGDRLDFAEAMLEIGLVVCSITLLTRQRPYWLLGTAFGAVGVIVAATAFLIH